MRRWSALLLVVLVVVLIGGCDDVPAPGDKIDVDTPELVEAKQQAGVEDCTAGSAGHVAGGMPKVTLPCLGGGPDVDVASLRGPMLVSIWAFWCGPCRDEMPILQSFYDAHGDQVPVMGVDYQDAQPGGALALMEATGATYPSLADPYGALSAQAPLPVFRGLPFLLFVDAEGKVAHVLNDEVESERQLRELVDDHLGIRL
jgi:thiol-disulfide isomerase/thioredoxin